MAEINWLEAVRKSGPLEAFWPERNLPTEHNTVVEHPTCNVKKFAFPLKAIRTGNNRDGVSSDHPAAATVPDRNCGLRCEGRGSRQRDDAGSGLLPSRGKA